MLCKHVWISLVFIVHLGYYLYCFSNLNLLYQVPLEVGIRSGSDEGLPIVVSEPHSVVSQVYGEIAEKVVKGLEELDQEQHFRPEITL